MLFGQEAATRLARMAVELLEIEEKGPDPELVASTFRDAHTLKGSAAIVELPDVATLAHAMEDVLDGVRSGQRLITPGLIDGLLVAVDGLRTALPDLLDGGDRRADLARLVEVVQAAAAGRIPQPVSAEPAARPTTSARLGADVVRVPVERLDEIVRLVGEATAASLRVRRAVGEQFGPAATAMLELHELARSLHDLQDRTMRARMVPVGTVVEPLRRAVRDAARELDKDVRWELRGGETELDRGVLDELADPLLHIVRNAVAHGVETRQRRLAAGKPPTGVVRVHAMQLGSEVIIAVADDGGGIDEEAIRADAARRGLDVGAVAPGDAVELAFHSGVSTAATVTEVSGRGVGLDVVREKVAAVRGRVEVTSEPGAGTEFRVIVPITLAVLPCLLLEAGGRTLALPLHAVTTVLAAHQPHVTVEGRPAIWLDDTTVPLSDLGLTLGLDPAGGGPMVVVRSLSGRHAFAVDRLIGDRDVVVSGLPALVPRLPGVAGISLEPDGSILPVLDPVGLVEISRAIEHGGGARPDRGSASPPRARILVVDDALAVRELQRSILERAGYEVRTASDGEEALTVMSAERVDMVLTDLEMPRMDGFELTEAIRAAPSFSNTAVLIITSRSTDADRRRGLEAGADGYIVKSAFDEGSLLAAVARLLGRPS